MSEFDKALSDRNVANAQRLMALFGHDMPAFWAMVSPALHMELPFAPTVRLPEVLEGEDALGMFRTAAEVFDVKFNSVEVTPLADPHRVLVEYRGYGEPGGVVYDQRYVGVHEYRDDKLVFYREYFDTGVVTNALGAYLPPA
ncbi:nuclear transport factor 2 family protein [Novosphingobium sp. BL-52-GroH]|uniref:nuclear transport factor 2 family protein n=1 Tax=Novosphingobium sp. BL-52-GroH TaxID=3349877 RepID=UPI00384F6F3E